MTKTVLRCRNCGATWVSVPVVAALRRSGRCLRCDGPLVEAEEDDDAETESREPDEDSDEERT